jgi:hypothetical protein
MLADFKYLSYPNIEPGYLWVKLEPEMPHDFKAENVTVHVTFIGELPIFNSIVPPEEGGDDTPGQPGTDQPIPDVPVIPDPDPDPDDPEEPPVIPPPSETQDDINPYLLPYDKTSFDMEGLSERAPGTRLRSPFRRYWKGTITRDPVTNTIVYGNDENTISAFSDQSILYLSANNVATFTASYDKLDGTDTIYLTNYYMREN